MSLNNRLLGAPLSKRIKQVPYGKQREAKHSTPEIKVMANAILEPPMHPRKQVERFADVSKDNHH